MMVVKNRGLPSKTGIAAFLGKLLIYMFPVFGGGICYRVSERSLRRKLKRLLKPLSDRLAESPGVITEQFFSALPDIIRRLNGDAATICANDPAATGVEEVIMTYPGFYAIMVYRLANRLSSLDVPLVPRVMTEYAHSKTGIDIHPKAAIGPDFFIDHGTGIVIGETSVIGSRVRVYQGVTIGALSVSKEMASTKRHPTIEDDVILYAGSTILGGETVIGHDSIVGGNCWITESVPPFSIVFHENKVKIRERGNSTSSKMNL